MIAFDGVSKSYGTTTALRAATFALEPGKTTVLIGPSGCGKSTILRLMIGLTRPTAGVVRFEDAPLTPENVREIRHRMGYVIQEGGLFPHLTARANVALLARHLGWSSARIEARVQELAALVRLPPARLGDYPAQLSGGQRQRVGLMRALMLDPDVLLLDEPLGALDPMIRAGLQSDLRDIFRRLAKTVVMVTHDIGEAGHFGDVIFFLRDGRILQRGALRDLVFHPADPFVEAFINAQRSPLESLHTPDGA
jgi:osmoprotectant transport system ATP-binding protein